eukprot:Skav206907  [mRNA]  locus=scaffold808:181434:185012:+ [translate_table: standard]
MNGVNARILEQDSYALQVESEATIPKPHDEVTITQQHHKITPDEIFAELNAFWNQYWQTNNPEDTTDALQSILEHVKPLSEIDLSPLRESGIWLQGIKRLKPHSSKGVDGISTDELKVLPDQCITHLGEILLSYESGFPDWMMRARTHPVPKKVEPLSAADTRPITVLAQLYRLWSSVITRFLLNAYAPELPDELAGFVPGKSAPQASYTQQHMVEIALEDKGSVSGFTLDLVKCFNTVRRPAVEKTFLAYKIPTTVVKQWKKSLDNLTRVWILDTACSEPTPTSNGLTEGDPLSVLAMIIIGLAWIHYTQEIIPEIKRNIFADNWTWFTHNAEKHASMATHTMPFIAAYGMKLDWKKSWVWAAGKEDIQELKQALQPHAGQTMVKELLGAMDLGTQLNYRGPYRLGKYADRLKEAERRLKVIQRLPYDLPSKCHLILTSVYPQVFYGIEVLPLGNNHLQTLRSQVGRALFGKSQSRNTMVALHCTPKFCDPELYVRLKIIKTAKTYLNNLTSEGKADFLSRVAKHTGVTTQCHGPIGCLKRTILAMGWTITPGGGIEVSQGIEINLVSDTFAQLQFWMEREWNNQLMSQCTKRQAWLDRPPILIGETRRLIAKFKPHEQEQILSEISGSFQTAQQQAIWDKSIDGNCKYCGEPDTHKHRVWECACTHDIRQQYVDTLAFFREQQQPIEELPVLFQHDDDLWFRTCQWTNTPVDIHPDIFQKLVQVNNADRPLVFYTDGSCIHPTEPSSRTATYAIVVDIATSDEERKSWAATWETDQPTPPTFLPIAFCHSSKIQKIPRAELEALVYVAEKFEFAKLFTDSSCALKLAQHCQAIRDPRAMHMHQDADLVIRLWHAIQKGTHQFHKVKAHALDQQDDDLITRYHKIGNHIADRTANLAMQSQNPHITKLANKLAEHHAQARTHLEQYYRMLLAMFKHRAILDAEDKPEVNRAVVERVHEAYVQDLIGYTIPDPWHPPPIQYNDIQYTSWGPTLSQQLATWMNQVKWPSQQADTGHQTLGVTWVELALSFILTIGTLIPVKRKGSQDKEYLMACDSPAHAHALNVKLSEQADTMQKWVVQLLSLQYPQQWPELDRGLVRSLYTLGAHHQSSGSRLRASFPHQQQVIEILCKYLAKQTGTAFSALPEIPYTASKEYMKQIHLELEQTWSKSCQIRQEKARQLVRRRQRDERNAG